MIRINQLQEMALLTRDIEAKKISLIQTLRMARQCESSVSRVVSEISTLSEQSNMINVFLPLQNDLVVARRLCVSILFEMVNVETEQLKRKRLTEEAKAPVERVSYINQTMKIFIAYIFVHIFSIKQLFSKTVFLPFHNRKFYDDEI